MEGVTTSSGCKDQHSSLKALHSMYSDKTIICVCVCVCFVVCVCVFIVCVCVCVCVVCLLCVCLFVCCVCVCVCLLCVCVCVCVCLCLLCVCLLCVCVCVFFFCVCVCVLVYATLRGPNVPTRMVNPDIFDIVGTGLWSQREKAKDKNNKWCLSESVTIELGLG